MTTTTIVETRSEKGVALIIVLLLMAVLSGLATGFAMNGNVESTMAVNEVYYAGARAAAEAGMNRAIEAIRVDNSTDLLSGADAAVDAVNAAAEVNTDNGSVGFMLTGASPYGLDANNQYRYTIQILDDDDPALYGGVALTAPQLLAMAEDGIAVTDANDTLILRVTGLGPSNTVVQLARVLTSAASPASPATTSNPAIIVDGDLDISGNPTIDGDYGSVHSNGDLDINGGSTYISQNATASGDFEANDGWEAGDCPADCGTMGGNMPSINVPTVNAEDYLGLATHLLKTDGTVILVATGLPVANTGWELSGGDTWQISGNSAAAGTFYVEGNFNAKVSGNPGSSKSPVPLSIISTGSIEVSGNPYLTPQNASNLQFITNGDLKMNGNLDADPLSAVEGQSLVRAQLMISGNPDIRGQIIVKNGVGTTNIVDNCTISGNPTITYNGGFDGIVTPPGPTVYTNNVRGWMEQQ